ENKRKDSLINEIDRYQKRIARSNIWATIGMTAVVIYLTALMLIYPDEKITFYIALVAIDLLSIGVVWLLWSRRIKSGKDLSMSSVEYARYQLKKLNRTRLIIEFSPLYGLVLGILVSLYAYSLIGEASGEFVFWMININWVYIIVVSFISQRVKMRKFRKRAEPIIAQLKEFIAEE
ncbi:MAG: hypothetical protein RJQ14_25850, partial [Marinoscillum sp.]